MINVLENSYITYTKSVTLHVLSHAATHYCQKVMKENDGEDE